MDDLARKTDLPGRFTYTSQRECAHTHQHSHAETIRRFCRLIIGSALLPLKGFKNENDMVIVEAKYDEFALVYVIKTKNGVQNVVNKLYGELIIMHQATIGIKHAF